jgi:Flp pilus assembly pilin Flp
MRNALHLRDRRKSARDAGAVATEFALLMAFVPLTVIAFGIVDYGEIMAQATSLAAVLRGAAEYARGQVVQGNPLPTAANLNTLLGVPAAVFAPPPSSFCTCADGSTPPPLPTCPTFLGGADNPCAASPPANGDLRVLTYVAVSGSQTYTPLISGTWSFPGSVNARTVLRTQ